MTVASWRSGRSRRLLLVGSPLALRTVLGQMGRSRRRPGLRVRLGGVEHCRTDQRDRGGDSRRRAAQSSGRSERPSVRVVIAGRAVGRAELEKVYRPNDLRLRRGCPDDLIVRRPGIGRRLPLLLPLAL